FPGKIQYWGISSTKGVSLGQAGRASPALKGASGLAWPWTTQRATPGTGGQGRVRLRIRTIGIETALTIVPIAWIFMSVWKTLPAVAEHPHWDSFCGEPVEPTVCAAFLGAMESSASAARDT